LAVFAKTSKAAARLARSMQQGLFTKEYLAIVRGTPPAGESRTNSSGMSAFHAGPSGNGICDLSPGDRADQDGVHRAVGRAENSDGLSWIVWQDWLLKNHRTNMVSTVPPETGDAKKAVLSWTPVACHDGLTLVCVRLETGRSHQIRVQFSSRGYPLWGDMRYDESHNQPGMQLALFAHRLEFPHPVAASTCTYSLPLPLLHPWCAFASGMNEPTRD
jgi:23S rRNA-/tRNA-specific pseudouridylate synthase